MGRQLMHTSGGITKSRKKEGKSEREKRKKRSKTLFMNQVIPVGKLRKSLYISIFKIYMYISIYIYIYLHKYKSARIYEKERRLS